MSRLPGDDEIRTARLSLRRPVCTDIDAILRIHRDPRACAHNPSDAISTRDEAAERFLGWDEHWERYGFGYWTIRRNGESPAEQPLGFCGIKVMHLHGRSVLNLFYRLDPAAWGAGLATEAAAAVVAWSAANLTGRPLIARVRPANAASLKVAARVGLRRAPALDTAGEDGLDWVYATAWPPDE
jgi:[ribosomal protein S5]-alanine N-acetyltransferase